MDPTVYIVVGVTILCVGVACCVIFFVIRRALGEQSAIHPNLVEMRRLEQVRPDDAQALNGQLPAVVENVVGPRGHPAEPRPISGVVMPEEPAPNIGSAVINAAAVIARAGPAVRNPGVERAFNAAAPLGNIGERREENEGGDRGMEGNLNRPQAENISANIAGNVSDSRAQDTVEPPTDNLNDPRVENTDGSRAENASRQIRENIYGPRSENEDGSQEENVIEELSSNTDEHRAESTDRPRAGNADELHVGNTEGLRAENADRQIPENINRPAAGNVEAHGNVSVVGVASAENAHPQRVNIRNDLIINQPRIQNPLFILINEEASNRRNPNLRLSKRMSDSEDEDML